MKIYTVLYKNKFRTREIGRGRNLRQAQRVIWRFLETKGYNSPYWRTWYDEYEGYVFDVGSWSEFFYIKEGVV